MSLGNDGKGQRASRDDQTHHDCRPTVRYQSDCRHNEQKPRKKRAAASEHNDPEQRGRCQQYTGSSQALINQRHGHRGTGTKEALIAKVPDVQKVGRRRHRVCIASNRHGELDRKQKKSCVNDGDREQYDGSDAAGTVTQREADSQSENNDRVVQLESHQGGREPRRCQYGQKSHDRKDQ